MNEQASQLFSQLQKIIPRSLLTALVYRITRIRAVLVKDFLIRQFVKHYKVDVSEALYSVPDSYASFNDFFIRELDADARPIDESASSIVSPADGTVSTAGKIENERIFQAKGLYYTLNDLLATDLADAEKYIDGSFATIYLAPFNYHRVHSPMAGEVTAVRYVPGDLFSVNAATVSFLPNLFTRNERVIFHLETTAGPMLVVLVGALNVGSISTPWTGEIRPRKKGVVVDINMKSSGAITAVTKGGLLGWFNMGSTVIILVPAGKTNAFTALASGQKVRVGEAIGSTATDKA